uniref:Interleukin-1 n=1 Tax=Monodelphis domestica TaxID=13616 RepID=F6SY64_MONDO
VSGEQPRQRIVHDMEQQVWVLQGKILIGTPLNENVIPEKILTISCRDDAYVNKDKGNAIYMGVKSNGLALSCVDSGGQATLKLEKKNITDLYNLKKAEKPFVFYLKETGSTATFESAAYPDCFICSSLGGPITLTKGSGKEKNTHFHLEDTH